MRAEASSGCPAARRALPEACCGGRSVHAGTLRSRLGVLLRLIRLERRARGDPRRSLPPERKMTPTRPVNATVASLTRALGRYPDRRDPNLERRAANRPRVGPSSPRVANYMPFGLRVQPRSALVRWRSSVRSRAPGSAAEPPLTSPMLVVRSTTNRLWRPRGNEHLVVDQPAAIEPTCEEGEGTGRPGSGRSSVPIAPRPSALPSAPRAGSPAESGSWPCPEIRDRH